MVTVLVSKRNNVINQVTLQGHALYDVCDKDIVCSSISSITITTVNAIISVYGEDCLKVIYEEDCLVINILLHNDIVDKLIINMISLLKELEKDYQKNIKVREV